MQTSDFQQKKNLIGFQISDFRFQTNLIAEKKK